VSAYPLPQIGYWVAECCEEDLYQIATEGDLANAMLRIADNDENGELMVFRTEAEARSALKPGAKP